MDSGTLCQTERNRGRLRRTLRYIPWSGALFLWSGRRRSVAGLSDRHSYLVHGSLDWDCDVFSSELDGRALTFRADGDAFVDEETGSEWDITGTAVTGELEGSELTQIHHLDNSGLHDLHISRAAT